MKTTLAALLCISAILGARAQEQPPWHPIQNTNALPTNAIVCEFSVLTAEASSLQAHRHRQISVEVLGYFALSWCETNQPHALASGTLNYTLLVDGPLSPAATFHIFGPEGRDHAPTDLFDLDRVGSTNLGDAQIRDLLAGRWYLVVLSSGTPGGHLVSRITP